MSIWRVSHIAWVPSFLTTLLFCTASFAVDPPTHDDAVASITPSRAREKITHPYPMFYEYHVAPHAVLRSGKIFFTYQDDQGRPIALAYDIASNQWSGPQRVSDFGLGDDSHGNPSICLDNDGRAHIFYGAHGGPLNHAVSREPLRIDAWDEVAPVAPHATYPQSQRLPNGVMSLFYRSGGHVMPWVFSTSSNQGRTWSEPANIIEMRQDPLDAKAAAYCTMFPGVQGQTLHCFFIHKDDNPTRVDPHPWRPLKYPGLTESVYRYNLYYVRRDCDGKWTNLAGEPIELPITKRIADDKLIVFDSADEFTRCTAFAVDADDRPYARFMVGVVDWAKGDKEIVPWRDRFAFPQRDNPAKWQIADTTADLPSAIQTRLKPGILPVYDGEHGGISRDWFIHHQVGNFQEREGSRLFLGHFDRGWIKRSGGPAPQPE